MFELGSSYLVTMLEPGEHADLDAVTSYNMIAIEEHLPLVKFEQFAKTIIINVASPRFVKAERQSGS